MSEEIAAAAGDLATVQQLRAELATAQALIAGQKRLLTQAQERERIATEAYNQQQTSQRELEALYQAALVDWQKARADNAALLGIARRAHQVATYATALDDLSALNAEHPGAALLSELTDLRGALATAQAELDRSQPIVIAAARLDATVRGDGNGKCWVSAHEVDGLRRALEQARIV
jgi:hypothetical protein